MKRILLLMVIALFGLGVLIQTPTQAINQKFAERFQQEKVGESGAYAFDKAHSFIGLKGKHMALIETPRCSRDYTATVNFDSKNTSKSSVDFNGEATGVAAGVVARNKHVPAADFFKVEKIPEMTFKSTKVDK